MTAECTTASTAARKFTVCLTTRRTWDRHCLLAHGITGERKYLERAKELATFILTRLKNPAGGYYDICTPGAAYLKLRLTLIEQNGPAASFFLALADATGDTTYREAALWAFVPFTENFAEYGIYAATLGQALGEAMQSPPKPNL